MSGFEDKSSHASEYEEVKMFLCIKCGENCTAAERASHRAMHEQQERDRVPPPILSASPTVSQQAVTAAPGKQPIRLAKRKAVAALQTMKPERKQSLCFDRKQRKATGNSKFRAELLESFRTCSDPEEYNGAREQRCARTKTCAGAKDV